MADVKMYKVIADQLTGKHDVYSKGAVIPETEVLGDLEIALNGRKGAKNSKGRDLKDAKPVIIAASPEAKKAASKKAAEK